MTEETEERIARALESIAESLVKMANPAFLVSQMQGKWPGPGGIPPSIAALRAQVPVQHVSKIP